MAMVQITANGQITSIGSDLASAFTLNDAFTYSAVVDLSALDSNSNPIFGSFSGALSDIDVNFGGHLVSASTGNVSLSNDLLSQDLISALTPFNSATGASVNGYDPSRITFGLTDNSGQAISTDSISNILSLDLADYPNAHNATIGYYNGSQQQAVVGTIESLSVSPYAPAPVPITNADINMVSGALALAAIAFMTKRNKDKPAKELFI